MGLYPVLSTGVSPRLWGRPKVWRGACDCFGSMACWLDFVFLFLQDFGWIWDGFGLISDSTWILGCRSISLVVDFYTFTIF